MTLLALPSTGHTTHMRCGMPEVVRSFWEAYNQEPAEPRAPRPSSDRIDRMEEALSWLRFIPQDRYVLRRIVSARLLVNPITERHKMSWRAVGERLGCDYRAVQRWHAEAIGIIVAELHRRRFNFSA